MMGPSASFSHLLRNLCRNTPWKYAVFWKLKHRGRMLLAWEESHYKNPNSTLPLDYSPEIAFLNDLPSNFEINAKSSCSEYSLCLAISTMSCHSYFLGEGIIGKVASSGKHDWILVPGSNSKPSTDYPEEWQPQVAAGIKTFLLVPVTNGVVHLGSLEKVPEDLKTVTHIKDVFSALEGDYGSYNHTVTSGDTNAFLTAPSRSLSSLGDNYSLQLHPESGFPVSVRKRPSDLDSRPVKMKEEPNIHYYHDLSLPFHNLDNVQLSRFQIHHLHEVDAEVESPQSSVKSTSNVIPISTQDSQCEHLDANNSLMVGCKSSNLASDDISFISARCNDVHQILYSEQPTFYDFCDTELKHMPYDSFYTADELIQPYMNELAELYNRETSIHDRNEVLGIGQPDESYDYIWESVMENVLINSYTLPIGMDDIDCQNCVEHGELLPNACEPEQLSDTVITNFYTALEEHSPTSVCTRSPSNSSEDIIGSCLTQAKYENDILDAGHMPSNSNVKSLHESDILTCSGGGSPSKTDSIVSMTHCVEKKYESSKTKRLSHAEKRKPKATDTQKPRPRDRQLIQDRVKELRELVPNGNKCSIDALLDRTVRHMTFLRSVSSQAEKLQKYAQTRQRVQNDEDIDSFARQVPENNATWAYEVGSQRSESCPIIVENIDQQGHMLVEMLCSEYGDFLEIAQVLRRLDLTILKGIMESRDQDLWAHFVVEGSRGFNRMEILWHLMQLLQQSRISIPSRLW